MEDETIDIQPKCCIIGNNTINFQDDINFSTISCLMSCIDATIQNQGFDGTLIIYFDTHGGELSSIYTLADYLNTVVNQDVEIVIKIVGDCYSAGTFFILETLDRCVFEISDFAHLMIHTPLRQLKDRNSNNFNETDNSNSENYTEHIIEILEQLEIPEDIIKDFRRGNHIYFTGLEFRNYLDNYYSKLEEESQLTEIERVEKYLESLKLTLDNE
jgi:ATP-dependent protease ClpP protease subunit